MQVNLPLEIIDDTSMAETSKDTIKNKRMKKGIIKTLKKMECSHKPVIKVPADPKGNSDFEAFGRLPQSATKPQRL